METFNDQSAGSEGRGTGPSAEILFFQALNLAPDQRGSFLNEACAGDRALHDEVRGLLNACAASEGFLESPLLASDETVNAILSQPDRPGKKIGFYKLLEEIGEGGFGTVWVAEQEKPIRRKVALKILKLGMDTKQVVARFEQERQALALMDHASIAKVFDAGTTASGRPYFAMELVKGSRITEYCDSAELTTSDRLRLFAQVCSAVQHAHQKGIIHRDLKPSNVLVTLHDGVAVPKVIDFGVAKAIQSERLTDLTIYTQLDQIIGTPVYMAPEQAELSGLDVDTRSDIYSLGVLLYELLTGKPPFDAATLMKAGVDEMRRVIREETPTKPSTLLSTMTKEQRLHAARQRGGDWGQLLAEVRGDLDWIVMKALEKDRRRRYASAAAFADDINRHLEDRTVSARPPSLSYRTKKFIQRNRFAVISGSAVTLALLVGLFGVIWQGIRAQREEIKANRLLNDLRGTAPAFAEQARSLVSRSDFHGALEKLDYAIQLQPKTMEYRARKAELLQSQLRFRDATHTFEEALELEPSNESLRRNLEICARLSAKADTALSSEDLSELLALMQNEGRSASELMEIGQRLGVEKEHLLRYWMERLSELPISPEKPLGTRLTVAPTGRLALDLSETQISDLAPLKGMPVGLLNLTNCKHVTDWSPLRGAPIRTLLLDGSAATDLSPITASSELVSLSLGDCNISSIAHAPVAKLQSIRLSGTRVVDLSPLRSAPLLETVEAERTRVSDLSPLQGKRIKSLMIGQSQVRSLAALTGMPLVKLDCTGLPISDFQVLSTMPLEFLVLESTGVAELSFLRGLPLKTLVLGNCPSARGYSALSELPDLEALTLPSAAWELPLEELHSILRLRNAPKLLQVRIGSKGPWATSSSGTSSLERFWSDFESDIQAIAAIKTFDQGYPVYFKQPDGSWELNFQGQNVKDLSPLRGKNISKLDLNRTLVSDLGPLLNMPLRVLTLERTKVRDLTAIRGAPLELLDLSETLVTDLEPLRGMPLKELALQQCSVATLEPLTSCPLLRLYLGGVPNEIDLSVLNRIGTLTELILPAKPKNLEKLKNHPALRRVSFTFDYENRQVAQSVAEFWSGSRPATAEELCRRGKYAEAMVPLRQAVRARGSKGPVLGLACAVVATGNQTAIQECVQELISMYDRSPDFFAATTILLVFHLSPEISVSGDLVDEAAALAGSAIRTREHIARFRLAEALMNLRNGEYSDVQQDIVEIWTQNDPSIACTGAAIMAIKHHYGGDSKAARAFLNRANRLIASHWPKTTSTKGSWEDWFCAHILVMEAQQLLGER
jgi:serine/threonine protein kinase/Leucine-rich repeat (LRR) protein